MTAASGVTPEYVVVVVGESGAVFKKGENFRIFPISSPHGAVEAVFSTEYKEVGTDALPVPSRLVVEVRGPAESFNQAVHSFTNIANTYSMLLGLSANAFVGVLTFQLGYEATIGVKERQFRQDYFGPNLERVRPARLIDGSATAAQVTAITEHADSNRLIRAVGQYHLALQNWLPGRAILSMAHLFMGMEALVPVALRKLKAGGKSDDDLVKEFAADKRSDGEPEKRRHVRLNQMRSNIRRDLLFRADAECHKKAKTASDGFEHGFLSMGQVRGLATEVVERTAKYLRAAIIELSELDGENVATLTAKPFTIPLGSWEPRHSLTARLVGEGEHLAALGDKHPHFEWPSGEILAKKSGDKTQLGQKFPLKARFAKGITCKLDRFRSSAPDTGDDRSAWSIEFEIDDPGS